MKKLELHSQVLGPIRTNSYFLLNKETKELLIVDPADSPEIIFQKIRELNAVPVGILLTHGHFDHIGAAKEVREKYQLEIYACSKEQKVLEDAKINLSAYQRPVLTVKADRYLEDLQMFDLAGFHIQLLHTPGHTAGSCCYYLPEEQVLFSGDTLFQCSAGRTDFPTGSSSLMRKSLQRLLSSLPEETEVYPGHESSTTIGYEKRYNPFV